MAKLFFIIGCVLSFLGVAFGAFGAHALKQKLTPEMLQVFEVGVRYQMYHAFALIVVAWVLHSWNIPGATAAGWFFIAGIVLFFRKSLCSCTQRRTVAGRCHAFGRAFIFGRLVLARLECMERYSMNSASIRLNSRTTLSPM